MDTGPQHPVTSLDPEQFPEETRPYKKDTIFKLISSESKRPMPLSAADQNAAIRLVDQNKREIAEKAPQQLLQLRKDIELVTLEVLITKYQEMLTKDLPEARWQQLFNDNPFILNLAFGYPVIKIQDQAHLGGRKLSGAGETITDFLVKHRISNNAALFEIKTPDTPLLNKKVYRGNLYTPSSDLAGWKCPWPAGPFRVIAAFHTAGAQRPWWKAPAEFLGVWKATG